MEQISQAESIALAVEFPNIEAFTTKIFKAFYKITDKHKSISVDVEYNLARILSTLTSELEFLPADAVDIVLEHFLPKEEKTLGQKDSNNSNQIRKESSSFRLSKAICIDNIDVMTKHVNQYFADIIYSITLQDTDPKKIGSISKTTSKKRFKANETKKQTQQNLLELAEEIWIAAPELLSNVMGQLEPILLAEEDNYREAAVRSIGKMIGIYPSRVSFVKDHTDTWKVWLGRAVDKSSAIRLAWIQATPDILNNRTDVADDISKQLSIKLEDPDEKVRIVACAAIGKLSVDTIAVKLEKSFSFDVLFSRLRDTKPLVRLEAFKVVGKLYKEAYPRIEKGVGPYINVFAKIPQKVLDQIYVNDKQMDELIDTCLNVSIFSVESDDMRRATRLLTVMHYLEEKGRTVFLSLIRRQFAFSKYLAGIIAIMKKKTPNTSQLQQIIKYIGASFENSSKTESYLMDIVEGKHNQKSTVKYLSVAINPESSYSNVTKAISEILSIEANSPYLHTVTALLHRTAFWILNRSTIIPILEISRDSNNKLSLTAHELLKYVSESQPALMRNHVKDIISDIERCDVGAKGNTETLKAANLLAERFPEMIPQTDFFYECLVKFSTKGSAGEAVEAIKLILYSDNKVKYYENVAQVVTNLDQSGELLLTHLAAISELYKKVPSVIEKSSREVFNFISNILFSAKETAQPEDKDWVEDEDLGVEGRTKIVSLGIYVNRLVYAFKAPTEAQSFANVVFTFLASTISNMGELVKSENSVTPEFYKSRLRLEAGLQVLGIATHRSTRNMIRPQQVTQLAFIVQDSVPEVRKRFVHKLLQYWSSNFLPNRFLPLVFMTAFEKDRELYHYITTWIRARSDLNHKKIKENSNKKIAELMSLELSFPSFVHMIVHHHHSVENEQGANNSDSLASIAASAVPGNVTGVPGGLPSEDRPAAKEYEADKLPPSIALVARYVVFYLFTVASEHNISLIYHMAGRIKYFQDNVNENMSPEIYLVSEISQVVIKKYQELRGWQLSSWPGAAGISSELFKTMEYNPTGKLVQNTAYFPEIYKKSLEDFVRKQLTKMRQQNGDLDEPLYDDKQDTAVSGTNGDKKNGGKVGKRSRNVTGRRSAKKRRVSSQTKKGSYSKKEPRPESEVLRKSTRVAKTDDGFYAEDDDEDEDEEDDFDEDSEDSDDELSDPGSDSGEEKEATPIPANGSNGEPAVLLSESSDDANLSDPSVDEETKLIEDLEKQVDQSILEEKQAEEEAGLDKPQSTRTRKSKASGTGSRKKQREFVVQTKLIVTRRRTRNTTREEEQAEAKDIINLSDVE